MKKYILLLTLIFTSLECIAGKVEVVIDDLKYSLDTELKKASVVNIQYYGENNPDKSGYKNTSYDIPEYVTYDDAVYTVTNIGQNAFNGCSSLTSINIPSSVTSIGPSAFSGCSRLTSINIPSGVTSIGIYAFRDCTSLASINIPSGVTSIGPSAFSGCTGLTSINIPSSVTSIGDNTFQGCTGLTSINIPSSVTIIGAYALSGCYGLTSITIPSNVTSIGQSAFQNCSGLTSITIPSSIKSIGTYAFYGCYVLAENVKNDSGFDLEKKGLTICDKITSDGICIKNNILVKCLKNIVSIVIPNSVTNIGESAFFGRSSLTSITIPSNVTSIGQSAFQNCTGLTSITIPSSMTSIGQSAFSDCTGLTSIIIPSSVTSIGTDAFYGCYVLAENVKNDSGFDLEKKGLTICDEITSDGICIKNNVLVKCLKNVVSIVIPSFVTSIGKSAFSGCTSLTSITIPKSVTSIRASAFDKCKLSSIIVKATNVPTLGSYAFSNQSLYHTTLLVPVGTWYDYAYDDNWYAFHTIRETAFETDETSNARAFTMKMTDDNNYLCYDKVNDAIGTINIQGLVENEPNNTWMTVTVDGKQYIYNLGAKKYLAKVTNNAKARRVASDNGSYILTDEPTPISISNGEEGIKVGNAGEFYFVMNDNLNVVNNLTSEIQNYTGIETVGTDESSTLIYNLSGQRVSNDYHGIVVKNGVKVMNK